MRNDSRFLVVNLIEKFGYYRIDYFTSQQERKRFLENNPQWRKCTWKQFREIQKKFNQLTEK